MSEKLDALEGQLSSLSEQIHTLEKLMEQPGWNVFLNTLAAQSKEREGAVLLKPLNDTGAVYAQEFMKGEVSGLLLAQVLVPTMVEDLRRQRSTTEVQLENQHESEKVGTDAGSGSRVDDEQWHGGDDEPRSD